MSDKNEWNRVECTSCSTGKSRSVVASVHSNSGSCCGRSASRGFKNKSEKFVNVKEITYALLSFNSCFRMWILPRSSRRSSAVTPASKSLMTSSWGSSASAWRWCNDACMISRWWRQRCCLCRTCRTTSMLSWWRGSMTTVEFTWFHRRRKISTSFASLSAARARSPVTSRSPGRRRSRLRRSYCHLKLSSHVGMCLKLLSILTLRLA